MTTGKRQPRLKTPAANAPAYEIGYRKPPAANRFKPGRSGNPSGRPRGARNKLATTGERLKSILLAEAYRTIKVNEGGREITLPMAQAVIRALAVNAARGQLRSQQLFATMLADVENTDKALADEYLKTMIEYKNSWDLELERRKRLGVTGPEPLPHPDDVIVNVRTGDVKIVGPITPEEKAEWERLQERVRECDRIIPELIANLKLRKNRKDRELIRNEIARECEIRKTIVDIIGEPKKGACHVDQDNGPEVDSLGG